MTFPHRFALHRRVMRPCPKFGHAFEPSADLRVIHEGGGYHLRTNGAGFRCERGAVGPVGGDRREITRPRIAVFGDSFTAGDGVDNDQRWTDRLQAAWDVDVYNFAVSGAGPDQNLLLAESMDLGAFDMILWAMATHTVGRIQMSERTVLNRRGQLQRVARPHFVMRDGELVLVPIPDEVPGGANAGTVPVPATPDPGWRRFAEPVQRLGRIGISALRRTLMPRKDADYQHPGRAGWQLFSAIVERFRRAAGDTPVVLIPLPTRAHLRGELCTVYRERFLDLADDGAEPHLLDVIERMVSAGKRLGRRRGALGGQIAFDFDGHYTPLGHLGLAVAVAEGLSQRVIPRLALSPRKASIPPPRQPEAAAVPARPKDWSMSARWSFDDSAARLTGLGERGSPGWRSEVEFTDVIGAAGALPWSAIAAELDALGALGEDIAQVRLESPVDSRSLAAHDAPFDVWFELAAPWIRWRGAAEIDLRQMFRTGARVDYVVEGLSDHWEKARERAATRQAHEPESEWLRERLGKIHGSGDQRRRERELDRLAIRWERTTRRARYSVLPIPAPS